MKGAVRVSGLRIVLFPQVALIRQSPVSGFAAASRCAMVAPRRRRSSFLVLPCFLGFRLAAPRPALRSLGSAPNFYVGRFQAASRKSASVLLTLWRMGFHSAFWNSAATETGR